MLKADWFHLPLERELTLIKIDQEIDECRDVDILRKSLKEVTRQSIRFQHMISEILKEQMSAEIAALIGDSKIEKGTS